MTKATAPSSLSALSNKPTMVTMYRDAILDAAVNRHLAGAGTEAALLIIRDAMLTELDNDNFTGAPAPVVNPANFGIHKSIARDTFLTLFLPETSGLKFNDTLYPYSRFGMPPVSPTVAVLGVQAEPTMTIAEFSALSAADQRQYLIDNGVTEPGSNEEARVVQFEAL